MTSINRIVEAFHYVRKTHNFQMAILAGLALGVFINMAVSMFGFFLYTLMYFSTEARLTPEHRFTAHVGLFLITLFLGYVVLKFGLYVFYRSLLVAMGKWGKTVKEYLG